MRRAGRVGRERTEPADPWARLRQHRFGDVALPCVEEASFLLKPMFGCLACYLHGRLMLVLADRRPPWRGLLVPTSRAAQPALRRDIPSLVQHPVLAKWLHLPDEADDFDEAAARLVALACAGDPRLGVESTPRRRRTAKVRSGRRARGA